MTHLLVGEDFRAFIPHPVCNLRETNGTGMGGKGRECTIDSNHKHTASRDPIPSNCWASASMRHWSANASHEDR